MDFRSPACLRAPGTGKGSTHMRFKRFLLTMGAGFAGAAVLFVGATALGLTGGQTATSGAAQTSYAAYQPSSGLDPQQIYDQNAGSVVQIVATFPGTTDIWGQSSGGGQALGTGFVVSEDGYILTNAHVVSESGQAVSTVDVIFKGADSQQTTVQGTVVGADESTDVALVKVDPSQAVSLKPVQLGDSTQVKVGEAVVAIGNPLGLDLSLSSGVVSAVNRELQSPNGATITGGIQTDAAINPGNSGGPLFDASGKVIGINEQIDTQSGGNEGIGFAVPINTAVQVMEQIKSGQLQQAQPQTTDPSYSDPYSDPYGQGNSDPYSDPYSDPTATPTATPTVRAPCTESPAGFFSLRHTARHSGPGATKRLPARSRVDWAHVGTYLRERDAARGAGRRGRGPPGRWRERHGLRAHRASGGRLRDVQGGLPGRRRPPQALRLPRRSRVPRQ